jgi:hypothetical protein
MNYFGNKEIEKIQLRALQKSWLKMTFISYTIRKGEELQILHLLKREISPAVTRVVVYGDNQLENKGRNLIV